MFDPGNINDVIRCRRAVFPMMYNDRPIEREIIRQILLNANWAPSHKLTEPWRFKVMTGKALQDLGQELARLYKMKAGDRFSEIKYKKNLENPSRSACVIAICMQRDPKESLPEWEEIAAVACSVQNMWLTCTAYNIGSYWSSPDTISDIGDFLQLANGERCLGFFYMGYYDTAIAPTQRKPIEGKILWME